MTRAIPGLHHITAISGPAQRNLDFYTGPVAQRLVKQTVNFDDPGTYHLYYGNEAAEPGSILTFFPFADAAPGRAGPGMASAFAYTVPKGGLNALMERFADAGMDFAGPSTRFGAATIALSDPDGLTVEFVEGDDAAGDSAFHSVTLWERDPEPTARILTDIFGYKVAGSEIEGASERFRFRAPGGAPASVVDIIRVDNAERGRPGAGTVHHVAFRAPSYDAHEAWRETLASKGHDVTPIIDRQYFNAIYFREPGGVLFEIATDPPGFAIDEPQQTLGQELKLPPRYEANRKAIEARLTPLRVPA